MTHEVVLSSVWRRHWQRRHRAITKRHPLHRHLLLARALYTAGVSTTTAAWATATAAAYEVELRRLGADVEAVAQQVRKFILLAALSSPSSR